MKSAERNLLDEATLGHNVASLKAQLARFLDFDSEAPNKAELVNNYDWMKDYSFINFIRDIGKHITVNYMMAKDSVKKTPLPGQLRGHVLHGIQLSAHAGLRFLLAMEEHGLHPATGRQ